MRIHSLLLVVAFVLGPVAAWAQDVNKIYFADQTVKVGETGVKIPVLLDTNHADGWFGFSVAIKYDQTKLSLKSMTVADTVAAPAVTYGWGTKPSEYKLRVPEDGKQNYGLVMDLGHPDPLNPSNTILDQKIPAGNGQKILYLVMDVLATEAGTTTLEPRNDLAPVDQAAGGWVNILCYSGEAPTRPTLAAGTITIAPAVDGTKVKRGDVDASGDLNLTDAVVLLGFLFLGNPTTLACENQADVNDSEDLNLTDAVVLLGYLFLGNPVSLAAPGETCGLDPTVPATPLTCASPSCP